MSLSTRIFSLLALSSTVFASNGNPNNGTTDGLASSWPLGVCITDATGSSAGSFLPGIRVKNAGNSAGAPQLWNPVDFPVGPSYPNYTLASQIDVPGFGSLSFTFDGISTGNSRAPRFGGETSPGSGEWIADGVPNIPPSAWFAVSVSIDAGDSGGLGSKFNDGRNEVVSYYFSGNTILTPNYQGKARAELSRRNLGLNGNPSAQLNGFDYGLGFVVYNHPNLPSGMFDIPNHFYFSITPEKANQIAGANFAIPKWGNPGDARTETADAADIYRREWLGSSWSDPIVHYTREELGLVEGANVDAVDVGDMNSTVIYSVRWDEGEQPFVSQDPNMQSDIMAFQEYDSQRPTLTGGPWPLRDSGDEKMVTEKLKVGKFGNGKKGTTRGLCGVDPEASITWWSIGTPLANPAGPAVSNPLGISACRGMFRSQLGDGQMRLTVSGWGGHPTKTSGRVVLMESDDAGQTWGVAAQASRNALAHTVEFRFTANGTNPTTRRDYQAFFLSDQGYARAESEIIKILFD